MTTNPKWKNNVYVVAQDEASEHLMAAIMTNPILSKQQHFCDYLNVEVITDFYSKVAKVAVFTTPTIIKDRLLSGNAYDPEWLASNIVCYQDEIYETALEESSSSNQAAAFQPFQIMSLTNTNPDEMTGICLGLIVQQFNLQLPEPKEGGFECCICKSSERRSPEELHALECGHIFHFVCIMQWLEAK